jgi:2-oxoglutarate ferredoxin oxidoreductase subunit alpha
VVSWGSTKGPILDALDRLVAAKESVGFLQLRLLNPFPSEAVMAYLAKAKRRVNIEMNFSAQLGGLIRERTGVEPTHLVVKYNGRPMSSNEIHDAVKAIIHNQAPHRTVLTHGA